MFLTVAKCFIRRYETYPSVIITNENGKGKPFFPIFHIFIFVIEKLEKDALQKVEKLQLF